MGALRSAGMYPRSFGSLAVGLMLYPGLPCRSLVAEASPVPRSVHKGGKTVFWISAVSLVLQGVHGIGDS